MAVLPLRSLWQRARAGNGRYLWRQQGRQCSTHLVTHFAGTATAAGRKSDNAVRFTVSDKSWIFRRLKYVCSCMFMAEGSIRHFSFWCIGPLKVESNTRMNKLIPTKFQVDVTVRYQVIALLLLTSLWPCNFDLWSFDRRKWRHVIYQMLCDNGPPPILSVQRQLPYPFLQFQYDGLDGQVHHITWTITRR